MDVLETYERPYDEEIPVVCLDEKSLELHDERHTPIRSRRGTKRDHEYVRKGTANLFMMTEPKGGKHYVRVTERRTRRDFAQCLKWLAQKYPKAVTIHLVMDNLNTHNEKSLVETYGLVEGRRLWARFSVHYTPKHASWLNQAEIAIGVTQRCCLGKDRLGSMQQVKERVIPFWKKRRNQRWKIDWRFTPKKAQNWLKTFQSEH